MPGSYGPEFPSSRETVKKMSLVDKDRIHKGRPRNYSFVFVPQLGAKILLNFVRANEANEDD